VIPAGRLAAAREHLDNQEDQREQTTVVFNQTEQMRAADACNARDLVREREPYIRTGRDFHDIGYGA
jgi:hypothetical protein